jgi:hypothetical protein
VVELRKLLEQRFPHLRQGLAPRVKRERFPTGVANLDRLLGGGLPRGEFTELVARGYGTGSVAVLHEFLRSVAATKQFLALVDGMDSLDVEAIEPAALKRLLWIRCRNTAEALKATDLLLGDRNFSMVALDLKLNPMHELRKITASIWFRYARLVEQNQATVLVITPQPLVSVAAWRLSAESGLGIEALQQTREQLLARLRFAVEASEAEVEGPMNNVNCC